MIRYSLQCGDGHEFEGWFASSDACDKQLKRGLVECPDCGSTKVEKALMAPSVSTSRKKAETEKKRAMAYAAHQAKLEALRNHVEQNFENVGDRFAEESRKIHYGETEKRDIYGEATLAEAKDLIDEGIEVAPLPGKARTDA